MRKLPESKALVAAGWFVLLLIATLVGIAIGLGMIWLTSKAGASCQTKTCNARVRQARAWDLCVKRHGARYCTYRHEEALAVIRWTKRVGFHSTRGWPNCP